DVDDGLTVRHVDHGPLDHLFVGGIHKVLRDQGFEFLELLVIHPFDPFLVLVPVKTVQEFLWVPLFVYCCCHGGFLHFGVCFFFSHLLINFCIPRSTSVRQSTRKWFSHFFFVPFPLASLPKRDA